MRASIEVLAVGVKLPPGETTGDGACAVPIWKGASFRLRPSLSLIYGACGSCGNQVW